MRRFANFYIILFLIDAGLSLTDELASIFLTQVPGLSLTRNIVAVVVVLLSVVVYSLLGLDRRLPKRIFVPMTLYVFWCSLGLWPLQGMLPRDYLGLSAAVGQVAIGGIALAVLRNAYGRNLLREGLFNDRMFGWRNTLVFTAVNLLLLPFMLVFSLLAMVGYSLDQQTAGFMRVSPLGIYTSERSYGREGKEVRLVAMMHVARKGYYEELVEALPGQGAIVLAEGVSDRERMLKGRFQYGRLADLTGLSSQETMQLEGNLLELDDLEPVDDEARDESRPDIVRADLDVVDFDPQTVDFLNVLARTVLSDMPLGQGLAAYVDWERANGTQDLYVTVMDDILYKRNAVVIDTLERSLERYDTIVVPWGGMHMPAIEAAVLEAGFVPGRKTERLLFDFAAIPFGALWHALSAPSGPDTAAPAPLAEVPAE